MEKTETALTRPVHKKARKGKIYVPRAPKQRTPEQLLGAEQVAHRQTCIKLDGALARLKDREQESSNSRAMVQTLQQQVSGLSAELQQKQIELQLTSSQLAEAHGRAAALDTTVSDKSVRLLAQERELQQQRSAAHELAAHKQQAACTAREISQLQLAHGATLAKLTQCKKTASGCIATLQQQLQNKDVSMLAAQACKQAALDELAAQESAFQAASSQIAVLQKRLAVTQDSLAVLQDKYQAAQDDLEVQKAATFAAEALVTGFEVNAEYLTASLSQAQRSYEVLSADLAVHKSAASTAESRNASLQVLLQDSSNKCAELQKAHDDLAGQASAAVSASNNRVQELQGLLQDALATLQQVQMAKEASLDVLTNIAAECMVSQAASEFAMGQQLKAAAKTQRDKCAVLNADIRGYKWQLAKSEASIKHLQHEVTELHQQLAAAAEGAVQVKVQLQTAVWGHTAARIQVEEVESAAQVVEHKLHIAQQQLADANDQLFDWACAATATSLSANASESSPAGAADGASQAGSPAPTVLLHSDSSSLRLPTSGGSSQRSLSHPTESLWNSCAQPHLTNLQYQQTPVSSYQEVSAATYNKIPPLAGRTTEVASDSITSKPAIRLSTLYDSLNQMFKRFGVLCSGGFSKRSSNSKALDAVLVHGDPIGNSLHGSQDTDTVPSHQMSLDGIADVAGHHVSAAAQVHSSPAAVAVAAVPASERGTSGTAANAPLPHLSRWGSAAAGEGDGGHRAFRSSDTAVSCNFGKITASHGGTAECSTADLVHGDIVATHIDDNDDTAVETATVLVLEKSAGGKAGPFGAAAMTDVGAIIRT